MLASTVGLILEVFDSLSYLAAVRRIITLTANVIMLTLWYHYSFEELLKFKFS